MSANIHQRTTWTRPRFDSAYATPRNMRHKACDRFRLGDCLKIVANYGERQFFNETEPTEFCVIDTVTRAKAWFEYPVGFTPDQITAMIESHFDASAFRVDARLWFV